MDLTAQIQIPTPGLDFRELFLKGLRDLVAFEMAGCHFLERSRNEILPWYEPQHLPRPAVHSDFWRIVQGHPLNRALFERQTQVWKISDFEKRSDFRATELYEILYRPMGVDCELAVSIPDPARPGWELLLTLHRDGHDFRECERMLLGMLVPQLSKRLQVDELHRYIARKHRAAELTAENFHSHLDKATPWKLTPRECEVVFWLCEGKSNQEIGAILGISARTAETHALRAYPKMGVENRFGAINAVHHLLQVSESSVKSPTPDVFQR